ncbi:MAG TPA: hypothetical protein VII12_13455 [Thermoanaerobaculia bacterium]
MKTLLFVILAVAICFSVYAASDSRSGVWTAELQDDHLQMTLFRGRTNIDRGFGVRDLMGFDEALGSFAGLSKGDLSSSAANVQFELRRAAGTISFQGRVANGTGAGHYRFTPNDAFIRDMDTLGYRGFSEDQLLLFAAHDFSPQIIRELRTMGYQPTQREVEEIAIFRITPDLLREFGRLGYPNLSLREAVNFRVGRVDAAYIKEIRELGYSELSARKLADMAIIGVTPTYVRELRSAGLTDLTAQQLTDLRIGRVTPQRISEYRKLGYTDLSVRQLGEFGIQGVTPKFIEELRSLGYDKLTPRQLIDMKIFGVTPDYIRKLNEKGYSNVPLDKLLKLRQMGADKILGLADHR